MALTSLRNLFASSYRSTSIQISSFILLLRIHYWNYSSTHQKDWNFPFIWCKIQWLTLLGYHVPKPACHLGRNSAHIDSHNEFFYSSNMEIVSRDVIQPMNRIPDVVHAEVIHLALSLMCRVSHHKVLLDTEDLHIACPENHSGITECGIKCRIQMLGQTVCTLHRGQPWSHNVFTKWKTRWAQQHSNEFLSKELVIDGEESSLKWLTHAKSVMEHIHRITMREWHHYWATHPPIHLHSQYSPHWIDSNMAFGAIYLTSWLLRTTTYDASPYSCYTKRYDLGSLVPFGRAFELIVSSL